MTPVLKFLAAFAFGLAFTGLVVALMPVMLGVS